MRARPQTRSAHARRAVLILAVCLLAACSALFVAAALLGLSADPAARQMARDLRAWMPYTLLAAAVFGLLWFVVQRAARTGHVDRQQSTAFVDSTTMQEMRDDPKRR